MCLLLFLLLLFQGMLFGPLEKVLKQREELTEGARKSAEAKPGCGRAQSSRNYEAKFNQARAEVYRGAGRDAA